MPRMNVSTLPKVQEAFAAINKAIQETAVPALELDRDKRRSDTLRNMKPISNRASVRNALDRFERYQQDADAFMASDVIHCISDALQYCYDLFHQYDYYMGRGDEDRALKEVNDLAGKAIAFANEAGEKLKGVKEHFGIDKPQPTGSTGCLSVVVLFAMSSALIFIGGTVVMAV